VGEGGTRVSGRVRGAGDEVFIPEGALHSLRTVHHATSVWLYGYD
jgi:hypothetical protein